MKKQPIALVFNLNHTQTLLNSLQKLMSFCESRSLVGYEPFDGNSSWLHPITFGNLFLERVLLQLFLRSPWHIRPVFGVPRLPSCQGMGYFARGYLRMWRITGDPAYKRKSIQCLEWLLCNSTPGYSGHCWGNLFYSASRGGPIPKMDPTIVWTSHIGQAFLDAYDILGERKYGDVAKSICRFILRDLGRQATKSGTCLAYGPSFREFIHNSNMLGAAMLARTGSIFVDAEMIAVSREAVQYTCSRQLDGGGWYYGEHQKYHWIDNWHTGYNLDSLKEYIKSTGDHNFDDHLSRGFCFFCQSFFEPDGRPRYYWNRSYLVDIQAAAQSIDTLSHFGEEFPNALSLAHKVASWTIAELQDSTGYFYYRHLGWKKIKVPMMHWGQSTMFCALTHLLSKCELSSLSELVQNDFSKFSAEPPEV